MTIKVTPELLTSTSNAIVSHMESATAIANGYLAEQENVMGADTWSGGGVTSSHQTATQIHTDLQKVLAGGSRLAEGLKNAAALMSSHESDAAHSFAGLFNPTTSV